MNKDHILKVFELLCIDEKEYLFNLLISDKKEPLDKIIERIKGRPNCPKCGKPLQKNGTKNSRQRWRCKSCKLTITTAANTSVRNSKKSATTWLCFLKYEEMHLSLRDLAFKCHISLPTAFAMRHKFQFVLSEAMKNLKLNGRVEVDGMELNISFKGTKTKNMVRESRKRGTPTAKKTEKIIVLFAIDESDTVIALVSGNGPESKENIDRILPFMGNINLLLTDDKACYESFAKENKFNHAQIKSNTYVNLEGQDINTINGLMSEARNWLTKYRGISSKHLQDYLSEFSFFKMLNYTVEKDEHPSKLIEETINSSSYIRRDDIRNKPLPINVEDIYKK